MAVWLRAVSVAVMVAFWWWLRLRCDNVVRCLTILHSHAGANYDAKGEKVYGAPRDLDKKDAYDELHALTTSDGMTMKDGITRLGLPDFHRVSSRTIRTVAEVLEVHTHIKFRLTPLALV